jgi:excisionase family DNA binding protein
MKTSVESRLEIIHSMIRNLQKQMEEHNLQQKQILNFREACKFISISDSKLYKMTSGGEIPFFKPNGGKIYFNREDLEAYLLQKPSKSEAELHKEAKEWIANNLNPSAND